MNEQTKAVIQQAIKAFWVATTPLAKDRQEVLAAITALRQLLEQPAPVRHPRWYCVDKTGAAILCADEDDARQNAKLAEQDWPRNAPYRAVQLCAVYDAEAAHGIAAEPEKGQP
jgi:hypothetical protein